MPHEPNINERQLEAALSAWRVNEPNYVHADDLAAIRWHQEQLGTLRQVKDDLLTELRTCSRLLTELHERHRAADPVPAVLAALALADLAMRKAERA